MGAWDHTAFGNDNACDWGADLHSTDDLALIEETLDTAINAGDYLDASMACAAIAAAEVVARLQSPSGLRNAYTKTIDAWIAAHPIPVPTSLASTSALVVNAVPAGPLSVPGLHPPPWLLSSMWIRRIPVMRC